MYCSKCGTELQKGAYFCTDCGVRVGESFESSVREALGDSSKTAITSGIAETKNNLSTPSLVLGILSVALFELVFIPIAAVVVSSLSLAKANALSRNGLPNTGKGKSIAGLVLGAIYSLIGFYYLSLW